MNRSAVVSADCVTGRYELYKYLESKISDFFVYMRMKI